MKESPYEGIPLLKPPFKGPFENIKGVAQKGDDLTNYMVNYLCKKSVKEITHKTAGMLQDILIVERILDWYNTLADVTDYIKIGTTQPNSLFFQPEFHQKHWGGSDWGRRRWGALIFNNITHRAV